MGVTSIVAGNCGSSALDIGEALTRIRESGAAVNFATLIGHNTVRRSGDGYREPHSDDSRAVADEVAGVAGNDRRSGRFFHRSSIRAGQLCEDAGDLRAGAHRRERRRGLRVPHAERGHGAGGGCRGDDPGGARHRRARADFTPQGRQPQPLGRQRQSARADRPSASERHGRRGRSVCLHGRQLLARHSLSGVGARGWSRAGRRAVERSRDLGRHQEGDGRAARRAGVDRPVVRRRGHRHGRTPASTACR